MKPLQGETKNTDNIMEAKLLATQQSLASCKAKLKKMDGQYKRLVEVSAELEVKLDEEEARVEDVCHIRHTEERSVFALTQSLTEARAHKPYANPVLSWLLSSFIVLWHLPVIKTTLM